MPGGKEGQCKCLKEGKQLAHSKKACVAGRMLGGENRHTRKVKSGQASVLSKEFAFHPVFLPQTHGLPPSY